jgi:hypothetical protein
MRFLVVIWVGLSDVMMERLFQGRSGPFIQCLSRSEELAEKLCADGRNTINARSGKHALEVICDRAMCRSAVLADPLTKAAE